jgi:hypothetical protein
MQCIGVKRTIYLKRLTKVASITLPSIYINSCQLRNLRTQSGSTTGIRKATPLYICRQRSKKNSLENFNEGRTYKYNHSFVSSQRDALFNNHIDFEEI